MLEWSRKTSARRRRIGQCPDSPFDTTPHSMESNPGVRRKSRGFRSSLNLLIPAMGAASRRTAVGEEAGHPSILIDEGVVRVVLERPRDDLAGIVDGEGSDEVAGRRVDFGLVDVPGSMM